MKLQTLQQGITLPEIENDQEEVVAGKTKTKNNSSKPTN